jgi:mannosyltransferase OCH1-like enzyme
MVLPSEILPSIYSTNNLLIPQNIFFIYLTGDDSKEVISPIYYNIQRWASMHPMFHVKIYTDHSLLTFLKSNYSEKVVKTYLKLKPYSFRCDLGRYCLLNTFGGIYCDLRIMCGDEPFTKIIYNTDQFVCPYDIILVKGGTPLLCGFIGSVPNHPFLKRSIERIVENVAKNFYGENAVHVTGPEVLGWAASTTIPTPFREGQFGTTKILTFSKKNKIITWNSKVVLRYKTVGGDQFNKFTGKGNCYWEMWERKDIYRPDQQVSEEFRKLQ